MVFFPCEGHDASFLPANHFQRYKRKQSAIRTRTLILCHSFTTFVQPLLNVFKEFKTVGYLSFSQCTMTITACKFFFFLSFPVLAYKKNPEPAEEANGFPFNPILKWQCAIWDREEAWVTMCIVIDYADPSSGHPFLEGALGFGGWRSVKQGDGWIAREKGNQWGNL